MSLPMDCQLVLYLIPLYIAKCQTFFSLLQKNRKYLDFFLLERRKKEIYVDPEFILPFTPCVLYCGNTASVIQGVTINQIAARTETPKKVITKMTSLISFPFFIQRASFGHKAHFIAPQCNCALSSTRLLL